MPHLPLIGNLAALQHDRLALFQQVADTCGDVGAFYAGSHRVILLNGAEQIHAVLSTHNDKTEKVLRIQRSLFPLLGNGLLNAPNRIHKPQRKSMSPLFQRDQLALLAPMIVQYAYEAQSMLNDGLTVNIFQRMMHLSLRIIGKALFGLDLQMEAPTFRQLLTDVTESIVYRSTRLFELPLWLPLPQHRRLQRSIDALDDVIDRRITHQGADESRASLSMLGNLLSIHNVKDSSSRQQLRDEIVTLFFAGHETLGVSLTWMWKLLSTHPEAYDHVCSEVREVLGTRDATIDDVVRLPYCRQIVLESMRLYPPAYILNREVTQPFDLPGGWHLPIGTLLGICPYTVHRRAEYWYEPSNFNPERFALDAMKAITRGAYLPFGDGPHVCIGNHLAIIESILILATFVQGIRFHPDPHRLQTVIDPQITLLPRGGIWLSVERHKHGS